MMAITMPISTRNRTSPVLGTDGGAAGTRVGVGSKGVAVGKGDGVADGVGVGSGGNVGCTGRLLLATGNVTAGLGLFVPPSGE